MAPYHERMRPPDLRRLGTAVHLVLGLGAIGIAGYAFVAIVGYAFVVPPFAAEVSALTSLYLLINIVGPGLFAALEPETSRAVSAGIALDQSIRVVIRRSGIIALWILAVLVIVLVVLWPLVLSTVLADRLPLLGALVLAGAGAGAVYWVRGVLSGQRRFGRYAVTLYLEGGSRLLLCLALLALAVSDATAYGIVFAMGAGIAAIAVMPAIRAAPDGPDQGQSVGMARSVMFLTTATLLSQSMANLAPVVVSYRMPDDLVTAGVFGMSFVLTRLPLMLFAPIQAVLVPQLSQAAVNGRFDEVRRRMRHVLLAVTFVGVGSAAVAGLVGPWAVQVLFNAPAAPSGWIFAALGLSTMLVMTALVLQPALLALRCQRTVMIGWVTGTGVFLALLFAPVTPIDAAIVAQIAGPTVVLLVAGTRLWRELRSPAAAQRSESPR